MTAISSSPTRRSFLAVSAATGALSLLPIHFAAARAQSKQGGSPLGSTKNDAILPFRVNVRGEDLADLRRRLAATRWPTKELVEDRSQGVQLATLRALARHWSTEYDWRKCEARLNRLPQFTTVVDGVKIHFIHVKSRHENALPLIMTHGWPGSVIELLDTIGPLTDPTKYGGTPDDAFHLVLPSLPGYGFSGEPTELGWDAARIARAWAVLMDRFGYTRYVAQGGDVGAAVTDAMGRQAPKGLLGIHVNLLAGVAAMSDKLPAESEEERAARKAAATFRASGSGYFLEQATRPQTIGYSLLNSPLGLASWMLDHDTDSYYKISRAFVEGKPAGNLTRDNILDNITLYWLTGTGASAARWYWEAGQAAARAAGKSPPPVAVPVGFTTFPGELFAAPRSWVEIMYPSLAYFSEAERGGHFAAWEEPKLFSNELRAAFKSLRK
ncbi:multidrug MFS transporter [Bradyrhizobium nanningense]|uniref:Multidrug MFS transporter n=1 Tax=Bradyrhizobium nanningense TaxID=1325118 RepID=A0A4V1L3L6_9BRAD|nr:epoxide hydrolase family protein [Bradyrhizobium nanningense]RXH23941.1 multidrug MFS transporter [Bradyrhizobium nanningense]RXH38404.1 multidrug MFS transporter [Bradyrhizobium nanningense]